MVARRTNQSILKKVGYRCLNNLPADGACIPVWHITT